MPLHIIRQDISKMKCDAIVNTTNRKMVGYSGVDLAIHQGAGPGLDAACEKLAPLEPGFAVITGGYRLDCKHIIHTVGPVWRDGLQGESDILRSCYRESLKLAKRYRCKTVDFPLISSGAYGYPKDRVLSYAMEIISEFLAHSEMTVYICVYDKNSYELSKTLADDIRSYIDDNYVAAHGDSRVSSSAVFDSYERPFSSMQVSASQPITVLGTERKKEADLRSLKDFLNNKSDGFAGTLFSFIDRKGLTDVECYKRANVDKKVFSKIKCNRKYKPSKPTAVAFAIALELDLEETKALLASAGLALSHSSTFDMIIEYFILRGEYNIYRINEALFEFDQVLLGSV